MLDNQKIAVISTGNGGQAMAAYLAIRGYRVALYARERERIDMFPQDREFVLTGVVEGRAKVNLISNDIKKTIANAHLILVTTPSQYQSVIAQELAPHLEDGQVIVLNPGRTFGTYAFNKTLLQHGCTKKIILAETETFIFTCRCEKIAHPIIYSIKHDVLVAAHDPKQTALVVDVLSKPFPDIKPAQSTLHTGFGNIGMIFHPLPILMNITKVEAKEKFLFYVEGISPLVSNVLERMDKERVMVAAAYGVLVPSAFQWLLLHYQSSGENLYQRIQNTAAYASINAPIDIDTRYIFEDILTGCVPVYFAGQAIGLETPIIKSVILWASTVYHYDFISHGRNGQQIDFIEMLKLRQEID